MPQPRAIAKVVLTISVSVILLCALYFIWTASLILAAKLLLSAALAGWTAIVVLTLPA